MLAGQSDLLWCCHLLCRAALVSYLGTPLQEALQRGDLSDEEDGEGNDVSEEDSQEAEEEEAADSDEQASESEDEQPLSGSLAEEESDPEEDESEAGEGGSEAGGEDSEAEEDADRLPHIRAEPSEDGADGDGGAEEVALDDTALRDGLISGGDAGAAGAARPDQEERPESRAARRHKKRMQQSSDPDSLHSLKRQLTKAKAKSAQGADINNGDSAAAAPPQVSPEAPAMRCFASQCDAWPTSARWSMHLCIPPTQMCLGKLLCC